MADLHKIQLLESTLEGEKDLHKIAKTVKQTSDELFLDLTSIDYTVDTTNKLIQLQTKLKQKEQHIDLITDTDWSSFDLDDAEETIQANKKSIIDQENIIDNNTREIRTYSDYLSASERSLR
jgi:hypothetical protein